MDNGKDRGAVGYIMKRGEACREENVEHNVSLVLTWKKHVQCGSIYKDTTEGAITVFLL